jgi:hypothetical protein
MFVYNRSIHSAQERSCRCPQILHRRGLDKACRRQGRGRAEASVGRGGGRAVFPDGCPGHAPVSRTSSGQGEGEIGRPTSRGSSSALHLQMRPLEFHGWKAAAPLRRGPRDRSGGGTPLGRRLSRAGRADSPRPVASRSAGDRGDGMTSLKGGPVLSSSRRSTRIPPPGLFSRRPDGHSRFGVIPKESSSLEGRTPQRCGPADRRGRASPISPGRAERPRPTCPAPCGPRT